MGALWGQTHLDSLRRFLPFTTTSGRRTTWPAATEACRVGEPTGSMPMMRADGFFRVGRGRDARHEPPSTDSHQERIDIGQLFDDLKPDRALPGHHRLIREPVKIEGTRSFREIQRIAIRFVPYRAARAHVRAPFPQLVDLLGRDGRQHENDRRHAGVARRARRR